jgi:anti-sigma B factor antagonist
VDVALRTRPPLLVLDLNEVVFFGSPGLSLLLAAHERALGAGGAVAVVAARGPVLRPLEFTGVTAVLDVFGSRDEALASVARRANPPTAPTPGAPVP